VPAVRRSQGSSIALVERLVLATFASPASLTRQELEEQTGLSRTVVAGVVASLVARGELAELRQQSAGTRGRPPSRYQRTALLSPVLLIKLRKDGSTSVSSLTGDGTRSDTLECAGWSQEWPAWSRSVLEAAGKLRDWAQLPPRLAVLSVPFPVAEARGGSPRPETAHRELRPAPWLEDDPRRALSRLLECAALVVNDANLAALGEASFGAGRGRRAVFCITVADGIGAGFVFDGRLFTGAHGFAGELAHVQVAPDGAFCVCGSRGCLLTETEIAVHGLRARPAPGDGELLGSLLGRAFSALVTTLDPDCVVVDARLAEECGPFIAEFTAELARRCPQDIAATLAVVPGEFADAERYGALAAADAHAGVLVSETAAPSYFCVNNA
jgi:predicted NBD/HSP70 family sugar kinase